MVARRSRAPSARSGTSSTTGTSNEDAQQSLRDKRQLKPQFVRIEVLGDDKVGKTSLICTLVSRHYTEKVPSVLQNVQIPAEESDENVVISITDTMSRVSESVRVGNAAKRSDAILLVYDLTRPETFQRLRRWLDQIAKQKELPVVLVGNKSDSNGPTPANETQYANQVQSLLSTYPFIVARMECSAKNFSQVAKAFYLAQKSVLYPLEPLYNPRARKLKPACMKAIKRIFRLYDRDRNGKLSRDELNDFQHDCFGMRLVSTEMDTLLDFLSSTVQDGVLPDGSGLNLEGFSYLWQLFIDRHRPESCWQALRCLGYNNELKLEIPPDRVAVPEHEEDQSIQLSPHALDFLSNLIKQFDANKDGNVSLEEMNELFSITSEGMAPWEYYLPKSVPLLHQQVIVDDRKTLPTSSWLACWSFLAQEMPQRTLECLFHLGYDDRHFPALEATRSRRLARHADQTDRNLLTCYLYCAPQTDTSRLVNSFLNGDAMPNVAAVQAVNDVVTERDGVKYLLLTEALPGEKVEEKADVVGVLFNPRDADSMRYVDNVSRRLPSSVPKVLLGISDDRHKSEEEDMAREGLLKQLPAWVACDDEDSRKKAIAQIVRTALHPPRSSRLRASKLFTSKRYYVLGVMAASVGAYFLGYLEKEEEMAKHWLEHVRTWMQSSTAPSLKA